MNVVNVKKLLAVANSAVLHLKWISAISKGVFTLDPDYNLHWLNHDRIRIGRVHTTVVKFVGIPGTCDLSRYVNVFHAVMAALVVFFWMKYIWLRWKHKMERICSRTWGFWATMWA